MDSPELTRTRRPPVLLEGVTLTYPRAVAPTLTGVTLHVRAGEFVSVVGASGVGKTTLLRLLTGQLRPTAGRAIVAGLDLTDLPARRLPMLRRRIGVTFQDARLLPGRTALENIVYPLELAGDRPGVARERAGEVLDQVGIAYLSDRVPEQMSGGEAQRVGIARALARRPQVLLVDEPTGNLDPDTSIGIVTTLTALADSGTAVVMVTHDVAVIDLVSRRVIRIADGTISTDLAEALYADTGAIPVVTPAGGPPPDRADDGDLR